MLMPVATPGLWIAERIGSERLRNRIGDQMLMPMRPTRSAAKLPIRTELFGIGGRDKLLVGNRRAG